MLDWFKKAPDAPAITDKARIDNIYRRQRWQQVCSMLLVYGLFYTCRLVFSMTKKSMIDQGAYTETELGAVGLALFWAYAVGKVVNGFLADRANVRKFIAFGLFVSACMNLLVGFHLPFLIMLCLWFVNGFAQATGAACCVVGQSRWYAKSERGTFYGIWSCSNNLGEALCYISTGIVMVFVANHFGAQYGWRSAFWSSSMMGFAGVAVALLFFRDSPRSMGLPEVNEYKGEPPSKQDTLAAEDVRKGQKLAITNWVVWLVALSGGLFCASRYAIASWGPFCLEVKGYTPEMAGIIVSINSIVGAVSSGLSGIISDKFFKGSRHQLTFIAGLMNVTALSMFMLIPGRHLWVDVTAMVLFGLAVGILLTFLGGLMAVDLVPRIAAGAALGIAGLGNYFGAGVQELVSSFFIRRLPDTVETLKDGTKLLKGGYKLLKSGQLLGADGSVINRFYDSTFNIFGYEYTLNWIAVFWIGMAFLSMLGGLAIWRISVVRKRQESAAAA